MLHTVKQSDSLVWKRMLGAHQMVEDKMQLLILQGNGSSWYEDWAGMGCLAKDKLHIPGKHLQLRDLFKNGTWLLTDMAGSLSLQEQNKVLSSKFLLTAGCDKLAWKPMPNGDFSLLSAYNIIRKKHAVLVSRKMIWSLRMPSKVSIFMWRLLNSALPFSDVLVSQGFNLPSKCPFCEHEDELSHYFCYCSIAVAIW